jgi:hypothetical protein
MHRFQRVEVTPDLDNPNSNLIGQTGKVIDPEYLAEVNNGEDRCNLVRLQNGSVLCFTDEELAPLKRSSH